jgi:hypothetical protein
LFLYAGGVAEVFSIVEILIFFCVSSFIM